MVQMALGFEKGGFAEPQKRGIRRGVVLLSLFKQQIMVSEGGSSNSLVFAEPPPLLLPFLDCPADVLVMANLYTRVFFQFCAPTGKPRTAVAY
jgi:hypothetical protein